MGKIKGQKKNEKLRVENGKCAGAGRLGGARPGAGRKKKPTLGFPVNAGRMFADAVAELVKAVGKHPYFADVAFSEARLETAATGRDSIQRYISLGISKGNPVAGVTILDLCTLKATVAYENGDSGEFGRRMAQVVAVAMRLWQLGEMELEKKGGAK